MAYYASTYGRANVRGKTRKTQGHSVHTDHKVQLASAGVYQHPSDLPISRPAIFPRKCEHPDLTKQCLSCWSRTGKTMQLMTGFNFLQVAVALNYPKRDLENRMTGTFVHFSG